MKVKTGNHLQLAYRANGCIAIDVFHDLFYLYSRQERQGLQLLTCHLVQIDRRVGILC